MKSNSSTSGLVSQRRPSKSKPRHLGALIIKNSNFDPWKILILPVNTWMTLGLINQENCMEYPNSFKWWKISTLSNYYPSLEAY